MSKYLAALKSQLKKAFCNSSNEVEVFEPEPHHTVADDDELKLDHDQTKPEPEPEPDRTHHPFKTAKIIQSDEECFEVHFPFAGQYITKVERSSSFAFFHEHPSPHPALYHIKPEAKPRSMQDQLNQWSGRFDLQSQESDEKVVFETHDDSASSPQVLRSFRSSNNLLDAVLKAYNAHLGLELSPDTLWNAFCQCIGRHINEFAEYYRPLFVDHAGQKVLTIDMDNQDWSVFLQRLSHLITQEVKCDLNFEPNFSTTTPISRLTAHANKLYSLKAFFTYRMMLACGYSGLRLTGTPSDWQKLGARVTETFQLLTTFAERHPFLDRKHQHWDPFASRKKLPQHPPLAHLQLWGPSLKADIDQFYRARVAKEWTYELDIWLSQSVVDTVWGSGGDSSTFVTGWISNFLVYGKEGSFSFNTDAEDLAPSTVDFPVTVCYPDNKEFHRRVVAGFLKSVVMHDGYVKPVLGLQVVDQP